MAKEKLTEVQCSRTDCLYYHVSSKHPNKVFCKHAEKPHYMKSYPCPLFKLDWQSKAQESEKFLKLLRR